MHRITKENKKVSNDIIREIKDIIKREKISSQYQKIVQDIGTEFLPEYSDEGDLEEWESVRIQHTYSGFYSDEKFQSIVEEAYEKHAKDKDIFVYFSYSSKRIADNKNLHFSKLHARTKKNVPIDLYEELDDTYRRGIYEKISKTKKYEEYDKTKFQQFKDNYTCNYLDDPNEEFKDYDSLSQHVVEKAKEIQITEAQENHEEGYKIVEHMSAFLEKYGIFLLIEGKRGILDGVCGYVGEKRMPTIVLYIDKNDTKNLRRSMFTIAHELYHLLYNEGEELANKFAGSLLTSDYFDEKITLEEIDIADIPGTTALLQRYYEELKVSFECIINTLFNSRKPTEDIRSKRTTLLRYKRRYIDTDSIDLDIEKEWIYESLPELKELDNSNE